MFLPNVAWSWWRCKQKVPIRPCSHNYTGYRYLVVHGMCIGHCTLYSTLQTRESYGTTPCCRPYVHRAHRVICAIVIRGVLHNEVSLRSFVSRRHKDDGNEYLQELARVWLCRFGYATSGVPAGDKVLGDRGFSDLSKTANVRRRKQVHYAYCAWRNDKLIRKWWCHCTHALSCD